MTRSELLTGQRAPLSMRELIMWQAHDKLTAREQEKASKKARRR